MNLRIMQQNRQESYRFGAGASQTSRSADRTSLSVPSNNSGYTTHVIGRLGETVRETPILAKRNPGSRVYCRVAKNYNLFVKQTVSGWHGVVMADGRLGWTPTSHLRMTGYEVTYNLPRGVDPNHITRLANQYAGVKYRWGGNNPATGLDCSGFVKLIFEQQGIQLPRKASQQALKGTTIHRFEDMRPGDRVYFAVKRGEIDHTGIYIGDGYFVHSARSRGGVSVDHLSHPTYRRSLVVVKR